MPVNGKSKGAAFERDIAKRLSLWVSDGVKEDCFWRSAMSGGRATVGARKGKDLARQAGDISAVSPEGHDLTKWFYIELKAYKKLDIEGFMLGKGKLHKFWTVCQREAKKHKLEPMLIVKQNLYPIMVLTPVDPEDGDPINMIIGAEHHEDMRIMGVVNDVIIMKLDDLTKLRFAGAD